MVFAIQKGFNLTEQSLTLTQRLRGLQTLMDNPFLREVLSQLKQERETAMVEVTDGDVNQNNEHFKQVGLFKGLGRVEDLIVELINETQEKVKQEQSHERTE